MAKKILIVDDSNIVLNLHTYILEQAGYVCSGALNGYVALEALLKEHYDLIVTDVNMPKMDGYELIKRIREYDEYKHVPIIIVSTEQEAKDKTKGFEAGANVYIVKPTEPALMVINVKMLLGE